MTRPLIFHWVLLLCAVAVVQAETVQGKVVDPSGAVIAGARVAAVNRVGVIAQTVSDAAGAVQVFLGGSGRADLFVNPPGLRTQDVPLGAARHFYFGHWGGKE